MNGLDPGRHDSPQALRAAAMPAEIIEDTRITRLELDGPHRHAPWLIQIARPACAPPVSGYPVLYLLDGDATFPAAWRTVAARADADLALVAIGYPGGSRLNIPRRYYDLTPRTPAEHLRVRDAGLRTGGREAFLDFITGRLRAEASRILPLDPARQTLFGHSLGGLFALHALTTRPAQFQSYAAADPSIWWNGYSILQDTDGVLAGIATAGGALAQPLRVHIATSGSPPPMPRSGERMAVPGDAASGFARALARIRRVDVRYKHHADESHGSLIEPSTADATLFACGLEPPDAQRLAAR